MYVIDIHYTASLERIDDALERHRAFLQPQFDKGIFIAAGPKVPREGGVILAARIDRDELDAILKTDPFVIENRHVSRDGIPDHACRIRLQRARAAVTRRLRDICATSARYARGPTRRRRAAHATKREKT